MSDVAEVYIGLGTNVGDRAENLRRAVSELERILEQPTCSPVYLTEPWGVREQRWFWNMAVQGRTSLPPRLLLQALQDAERRVGRTTGPRYGPRRIDLDLLLYGDEVSDHPDLAVPHPRLMERAFVLAPLLDLTPSLRTPDGTRLARVLDGLDRSTVCYLGPLRDLRDGPIGTDGQ